jgi:hypothetical protein
MRIHRVFGHVINCRHATRLVSRMQDQPLGRLERALLRLHLACCETCARFEEQVRFLREAMTKYRE